jgi:hypothetical protein
VIAETIRLLLRNLSLALLVLAVAAGILPRPRPDTADRLLGLLLLLPIGAGAVWAAFFHVGFPQMSAEYIGWNVSPFQYEVGMADLAVGTTGILAFWRSWEFRAAAVCAASQNHRRLACGNAPPVYPPSSTWC